MRCTPSRLQHAGAVRLDLRVELGAGRMVDVGHRAIVAVPAFQLAGGAGGTGRTREIQPEGARSPRSVCHPRALRLEQRARAVQPVQRDAAHDRLARLDVGLQEQLRLVEPAAHHRAQDLRVLLVGRVDAVGLGEIEAADDADALGDVVVDARELRDCRPPRPGPRGSARRARTPSAGRAPASPAARARRASAPRSRAGPPSRTPSGSRRAP